MATGEVVGAEGKEAIDGPELLDGNPVAAVRLSGFKSAPGMENSTIFFLRCTVVQGSWSSDHGSGSTLPVPKYLAPEITGAETRLVGQRVSTCLSSSVRWEATSADPNCHEGVAK